MKLFRVLWGTRKEPHCIRGGEDTHVSLVVASSVEEAESEVKKVFGSWVPIAQTENLGLDRARVLTTD